MAPRLALILAALAVACGEEPEPRHPDFGRDDSPALRVCASGPTLLGADVSHWEGAINWTSYAGSGRAFAIAKATDGLTFTDPQLAANWAGMKNAGVVRGAYHFFRPDDNGAQQADFYLSKVAIEAGDLPPILDWEWTTTSASNSTQIARVQDFVSEVHTRTGLTTILYSSKNYLATMGSPSQFNALPLWDANWNVGCPTIPDAWASWTFWQYSSDAGVPGVGSGTNGVDDNYFNGSMEQLQALTGVLADAGTPDAGTSDDAGTDAGTDAGIDAGTDAGADSGTDAGTVVDAGAPHDAGAEQDAGGVIAASSAGGCSSSGGAPWFALLLFTALWLPGRARRFAR